MEEGEMDGAEISEDEMSDDGEDGGERRLDDRQEDRSRKSQARHRVVEKVRCRLAGANAGNEAAIFFQIIRDLGWLELGGDPEVAEEENQPVKIAIIGRPNVGKSSLVNALLGAKRVIVKDLPGTTRDAVDNLIEYEDETYVLIDTAGIRRS